MPTSLVEATEVSYLTSVILASSSGVKSPALNVSPLILIEYENEGTDSPYFLLTSPAVIVITFLGTPKKYSGSEYPPSRLLTDFGGV